MSERHKVIIDFACPQCGFEKRISGDVSSYVDRAERLERVNAELLAALERARPFLNYILHSQDWQSAREQVDAAIAKARGEA